MEAFRLSRLAERDAEDLREELMPLAPGGAVIEESVPPRDAAEADAAPEDERRFTLVLYALDSSDAATLAAELAGRGLGFDREDLGAVDWTEAWKERHPPVALGSRIIVLPPWIEIPAATERRPVVIEPGMAFGLGDAPSTRFSFELMEGALQPDDRVADLGCGSGLLAIAARLLGAGPVQACDVEETAVEAAILNAERNGIAVNDAESDPPFLLRAGSIEVLDGPFDLIVANIVWEIIEPLMPAMLLRLAHGGTLVIGGIRPRHLDAAVAGARSLGLHERDRREGADIAALLLG